MVSEWLFKYYQLMGVYLVGFWGEGLVLNVELFGNKNQVECDFEVVVFDVIVQIKVSFRKVVCGYLLVVYYQIVVYFKNGILVEVGIIFGKDFCDQWFEFVCFGDVMQVRWVLWMMFIGVQDVFDGVI